MRQGRSSVKLRFTILDGIILIAAIAVGFTACRYYTSIQPRQFQWRTRSLYYWFSAMGFVVLPLSVGLGAIGLRGGRWRDRATFCRPGMAACVSTWVAATITAWDDGHNLFSIWRRVSDGRYPPRELVAAWFRYLTDLASPEVYGPAVLAAWGTLLLTGRWRPRRDWAELAGVVLGIYWVAAYLSWNIYRYFW